MKFVLLLAVLVVAAWMVLSRVAGRRNAKDEGKAPQAQARPAAQAVDVQPMVACAHCGVHLPAQDAVTDAAGRGFCSDAHRTSGPR
ncbi:MAG TPA: PP0621 family protein [Rubrivivax sp.]|nr:PP0621 family protein [Rubrivivax sp.]